MAAWIVAESLDKLITQLNALAPRRSKAADGGIGDAAHATRDSDHNPWLTLSGQPLVTARDFTHDPAGGLDCQRLADALQQARDPRVKYLIWRGRILAGAAGPSPWTWRKYSGVNRHDHHLHLSVVGDERCRDKSPWALPGMTTSSVDPAPTPGTYCKRGDRSDNVLKLQKFMTVMFASYNPYRPTSYYGLATQDGVAEFQRRTGITGSDADGSTVGPRTLAKLREHGFQS